MDQQGIHSTHTVVAMRSAAIWCERASSDDELRSRRNSSVLRLHGIGHTALDTRPHGHTHVHLVLPLDIVGWGPLAPREELHTREHHDANTQYERETRLRHTHVNCARLWTSNIDTIGSMNTKRYLKTTKHTRPHLLRELLESVGILGGELGSGLEKLLHIVQQRELALVLLLNLAQLHST
jgi:hypothetical protein